MKRQQEHAVPSESPHQDCKHVLLHYACKSEKSTAALMAKVTETLTMEQCTDREKREWFPSGRRMTREEKDDKLADVNNLLRHNLCHPGMMPVSRGPNH